MWVYAEAGMIKITGTAITQYITNPDRVITREAGKSQWEMRAGGWPSPNMTNFLFIN
jgi:hypothetical protein